MSRKSETLTAIILQTRLLQNKHPKRISSPGNHWEQWFKVLKDLASFVGTMSCMIYGVGLGYGFLGEP